MNNRTLLKYHSYLGLIAGIFLIVLGITGSILVFSEDIDSVIFKDYVNDTNTKELKLDKAINQVQKQFPDWSTRIINFEKGKTIHFDLRKMDYKKYVFVDPRSGNIVNIIDGNSPFTKWLLKFHYSLHSGITGEFMVLLAGIVFFLSLLTGIIIYRKVIFKTLLFRQKINWKKKRGYYSSLHRYVGVWALFLNLVIVITGIFLAFNIFVGGLKETKKSPIPIITISVEKVLKQIANDYPEFKPTYIRLPASDKGTIIINGTFEGDAFYLSKYYNKVEIDFTTAKITSVTKISNADYPTKLYSSILPLHSGHYGGFLGKILYCFIGLSGPFLSVTGYFLWIKSKK